MSNLNDLDSRIKVIREQDRKYALRKNRKKLTIISGSAAFLAALTAICVGCSSANRKKLDNLQTSYIVQGLDVNSYNKPADTNSVPENTSSSTEEKVDELGTNSLDKLGTELEMPTEETSKQEIGEVTGEVNPDKIVEDSNGELWATPEAEQNKDKVGTTVIDDQGGKLEETPDGTVVEKTPGYEIKDEDGKVVDEGNLDNSNQIPDGWEYDSEIDKYIPEDEVGKYVKDDEGNIWLKSDYEAYLKELEKEQNGENITVEGEIIPMEPQIVGVEENTHEAAAEDLPDSIESNTDVNNLYEDPMSGLYFKSKEDCDQWILQGYEGYGIVNGVMTQQTSEMDQALEEYNKSR